MNTLSEVAKMYKHAPQVVDQEIDTNVFTDMILQTKNATTAAIDKLAYLAGIKNAPADDKYAKLNTSNLCSLLSSAKEAGYDIEIVNI
ncbi:MULTISPECIES: XRE family transcriptional regulator [Winslowiella]|uniref:XRE family transcriptional regulator n=1 Tax=Winslowiella TaxID=2997349 RepID=UPI0028BF4ADF|nr:XRE family transcriptional regulator [Winslowiella toletana]WNN46194.1 XRE family transcriptional regulator [Winslowiella toletana]